jgi:Flp pilus assembly protein TadB
MYYNGDKMDITIRDIDEELYRRAKARAALMETTIGRVLNMAIERWLEDEQEDIRRKGFTQILSPIRFGKGTEHASERVDELVYGGRQ